MLVESVAGHSNGSQLVKKPTSNGMVRDSIECSDRRRFMGRMTRGDSLAYNI